MEPPTSTAGEHDSPANPGQSENPATKSNQIKPAVYIECSEDEIMGFNDFCNILEMERPSRPPHIIRVRAWSIPIQVFLPARGHGALLRARIQYFEPLITMDIDLGPRLTYPTEHL